MEEGQHLNSWQENLKEGDSQKEVGVDEWIILKRILENMMDWVHLAQDNDQ
jgi:hypothetical protein